ncbi:TMAO reductase system periplasmic protein TorT [Sinorhizobium alkalisoli]|uniref:TMAO reductase system periplasmic protein TorT n=1 Tax=Sinorhizobium alkalisoli TaxID=1752398 RepID=UPI00124CEAFD|nr:TMAO reductase system periplasmic protein TorT [Sinorhizobium alkalisoli]QFI68769.1 periplasmic binding protein/LacI transcriptional regulator [Sinorhizobium alkalisoli]
MKKRNTLASVAAVACLLAGTALAADKSWYPVDVESWNPPFDMASPRSTISYTPTEKPAEALNICVSVPHMKDAYWVAVDYGVTEEAKRQGVKMTVLEAGGYTNLARQISQVEDCVASGAQAVILGAISGDGLNNLIKEISSQGIPVIDFMNGVSSKDIAAKSLVSFGEMGAGAGSYIAGKHPTGSGKVKVAWFPGPAGAGWVEAGNTGFVAAISGSDIELVDTRYGDTGKEVQLKLVEDALQANPDLTYIVGTAPTAEAAIQVLKQRGLSDKIKVVSYYTTPSIYDAIVKKEVLAAPTDLAVIQARIAVDQAIRILEKKDYVKHAGPKLKVIDQENAASFDPLASVAPTDFKPIFSVE